MLGKHEISKLYYTSPAPVAKTLKRKSYLSTEREISILQPPFLTIFSIKCDFIYWSYLKRAFKAPRPYPHAKQGSQTAFEAQGPLT